MVGPLISATFVAIPPRELRRMTLREIDAHLRWAHQQPAAVRQQTGGGE